MIWSRVRQANTLRSLLREYYPAALVAFGTDLANRDALAVLAAAPYPAAGPAAVPGQDRVPAAQGRSATQPRRDRGQDQDGARLRAAQRPARGGARLRGVGVRADRGADGRWSPRPRCWPGRWSRVLASTRTLRSTAANPASVRSSAPGCWPSSATTPTATPTPRPGRTTPACRRSPGPPARNGSCSPATPATVDSATRCSTGPLRAPGLTRRPRLLRPAPRPRRHPLPSPPRPREPARRHPPRLPAPPHLYDEHRPGTPSNSASRLNPDTERLRNRATSHRRGSSMTSHPCRSAAAVNTRPRPDPPPLTAASTGTPSKPEESRPIDSSVVGCLVSPEPDLGLAVLVPQNRSRNLR